MKTSILSALFLGATLVASTASAHGEKETAPAIGPKPIRADGHAPIGVMGEHRHKTGGVMLSYRFMHMNMQGNQIGTSDVSPGTIVTTVPNRFFGAPGQPPTLRVVPTDMTMDMHMFGLMFAPIDRVTLMLMLPFVEQEMSHLVRNGARFNTRTDGIGDLRTSALIRLIEKEDHHLHAQIGVSFPTGSVTEQDLTPAPGGSTVRLPYPMQLGSGTYDFLPGLTYTGERDWMSWGAQARGEIRMNENHANYRQGHEYALTAWAGVEFADWISTSLRLEWQQTMNHSGRDESPSVNPMMVPTADPSRRALKRLDLLLGVNFAAPEGVLDGFRIAIEAGLPIEQNLDGPQLETDWLVTTGVQYAF